MKAWQFMAALTLGGAAPAAAAPRPVTLDAATVRRLAIATVPAQAASQGSATTAFARVLDPIPLAQLDSDIAVASSSAAASAAEAARSKALFAADVTVSRKAAETAAATARSDAARLTLLRRRLALEWGGAIARMSGGQRSALLASLAAGRSALVRIDTAGGISQAGLRSAVLDLGDLGSAAATILGPARAADPRLQSPGLIARVSGRRAALLSAGLSIPAKIGGAVRSGVAIPAAALLRVEGATWVYVQVRPGGFVRRQLGGTQARPGALFAASGVRPAERVVTAGAAKLYAAEHGSGPTD